VCAELDMTSLLHSVLLSDRLEIDRLEREREREREGVSE
jgi:hypothetical protein